MRTKTSTPEPITFRQNILFRDEENDRSVFLAAGEPSPWHHESEVPEQLRGLIGVPDFSIPKDTPNQHWTPREVLNAEAEAFRALNSNENMNESLREELESRDRAYLEISKSRNETETAVDHAEEQDHRRLVREMQAEADRKLGGK